MGLEFKLKLAHAMIANRDKKNNSLEAALIEERAIVLHLEWLFGKASTGYSGKQEFSKVRPEVQNEYLDIAREQLRAKGLI